LNTHTPQKKILQVEGSLNLKEGTFQAYGQDLVIEKGELLFSGNPENPGLNIRAIRHADDDVTAGIKVSGLANNPKLTVYSIPTKDSAEALSYLLTGHGLNQSNEGEALQLSDAAWALGMAEAENITRQIALKTGLDEVRLAGSTAQSSELVLGKYLTPDLYVRYVLGLFTGEGGVQLTYTLDKHWSVEGQTGAAQSVDVLYSLERD
jgi:translocation and assembly module TamB